MCGEGVCALEQVERSEDTWRGAFSPSTFWVPGIKLSLSELAASAFTQPHVEPLLGF